MKILVNGNEVGEILKAKFKFDKDIISVDKSIGHLKRNKKKYMQVVVILAYLMLINPELSYAQDKIVEMGYSIVRKIQLYAGIVAMVMAVIELAGELIKGGRNHFQIVFKYGVGYVALLLVPTVFEMIRNLF